MIEADKLKLYQASVVSNYLRSIEAEVIEAARYGLKFTIFYHPALFETDGLVDQIINALSKHGYKAEVNNAPSLNMLSGGELSQVGLKPNGIRISWE